MEFYQLNSIPEFCQVYAHLLTSYKHEFDLI